MKQPHYSSLARSLLILLKNNFIVAALSYLLTISLANYLGPEKFGIYSQVLIVGSITSILINFGTDMTATVLYSRIGNARLVFGAIYMLRIIFSISTAIVLVSIYHGDLEFFFFVLCIFFSNFNLSYVYEIRKFNERYSYIFLLERIFYVCTAFLLLYFNLLNLQILFIILAITAIISIAFQLFDNKDLILTDLGGHRQLMCRCVKDNIPIVIIALANYAYGGFSRLILEDQFGREQLGIYSAGWQIITIGTLFQAQISRLWRLNIANSIDASDFRNIRNIIISYIIFSTLPMIFVSMIVFYFSDFIVDKLFVKSYSELSSLLPVLSTYFVVINFSSLVDMFWIATSKNIIYMLVNVVSGILLTLFLVVYGPEINMLGFAVSTIIAHLFTSAILFVLWIRKFNIRLI